MIKWTPYVFVRLTIYLITGVLLGIYLPVAAQTYHLLFFAFGGCLLLYWLVYLLIRTLWKGRLLRPVFGLLALVLTVLFGYLRTYQVTGYSQPNHIIYQDSAFTYYSGTLVSEVQQRPKNYKSEMQVDRIYRQGQGQPASGKILVYLGKQDKKPVYGSQVLIKGAPQPILPPANPGEFDYRKYLENQQIYLQHFVKPAAYAVYGYHPPNLVFAFSFRLRQQADSIFRALIPSDREYAIASGLILGIRNGLDNELKQAYASAGAMHVLAVSGAHVVIVFEILSLLLGKLKTFRYGNWIFAGVILSLLWLYAVITGFSPSVLRAVVMFTLVVIAKAANRQRSIYNSLAISAFVLLVINPYFLLEVGFQLSYAAVLGIVYLFSKLYYLLNFNNQPANWVWGITCVSIAAQVATVPMSLYYFHQFPTYFLLANIPVIILSTIVLYLGLLTLAVFWIPYVSAIIAFLLKWTVWALNQSVFVTERIPGALIQGISISLVEEIILYVLIVLVLLFLHYKQLRYWYAVFGIICLLVAVNMAEIYRQHRQKELLIYSVNNHTAACIMEGRKGYFLADSALLQAKTTIQYRFTNYWWDKGIQHTVFLPLNQTQSEQPALRNFKEGTWLVWQGKTFLFLNKAPVRNIIPVFQKYPPDYLIVQNNALRNLNRSHSSVKRLIIDASNKRYIAERLKKQADSLHIPCYSVFDSGAFILKE
ncbi:ComEC family competence protein [Rhodocytophaga rosea]|uniref:ComEC family competence protein n=1 Tax=Rhodocytophaga rosea TaxID=2704465 RepID=A0A6C0GEM6_9BACT|nr:ComEC/Rec2 family competence protein [Rhodocytophaga rosea]QHT66441.1 ComEC family competence protein [Rhodocytophaga rosea]